MLGDGGGVDGVGEVVEGVGSPGAVLVFVEEDAQFAVFDVAGVVLDFGRVVGDYGQDVGMCDGVELAGAVFAVFFNVGFEFGDALFNVAGDGSY